MKKATFKSKEVGKRATQFYRIAWLEENDDDDESLTVVADEINAPMKIDRVQDDNVNKIHEAKVGDAAAAKSLGRRKWKIQQFSEFKNDKVKREQVRKLIKSKELMLPTETLLMKPSTKKRRLSILKETDDNNNVKVDEVIKYLKCLRRPRPYLVVKLSLRNRIKNYF